MQANKVEELSARQQILSSCGGAVATSLLMTPMDVLKTRMQAYQSKSAARKGQAVAVLRNVVRREGLAALWQGLMPTLAMAVPGTVMYLVSYEHLKRRLVNRHEANQLLSQNTNSSNSSSSSTLHIPLVAGVLSRVMVVTVISPLDLIRTKLQSSPTMRLGAPFIQEVSRLISTQGISALWRGYPITLWRDVPFSAIYWTTYEAGRGDPRLSAYFWRLGVGSDEIGHFVRASVVGGFAGALSTVCTAPFDVCKTYQQIDWRTRSSSSSVNASGGKSVFETFKEICMKSGVRGLFTGTLPRVAKVAPSCAIMIGSYEATKRFFHKANSADANGIQDEDDPNKGAGLVA